MPDMPDMVAIEVRQHGGPDVLRPVRRPVPVPGPGEVLIAQKAVGVNFVDLNHRAGHPYAMPTPFVPGIEAAGQVVAAGAGVDAEWIGRTVAYAGPMPGAYAEHAAIDVDLVMPVPDAVGADRAAAIVMQGMTAYYLAHDAHRIAPGETVVVHAAAGGVGSYLVQFAKRLGAAVVGTTRDPAKAEEIRAQGADHVVVLEGPESLADVGRLTGGCDAVYDSLGGPYVMPGLRCLRPRGDFVGFGLAAGLPPPLSPAILSGHFGEGLSGSLRVQWVNMGDFIRTPEDRARISTALFDAVASGALRTREVTTLPLAQARQAHQAFETGDERTKLVLRV